MQKITIRKAVQADCAQMLELIRELAIYEKAPAEVTVSIEHFIESGFGKNPVWWALVAEEEGKIIGMALYYIRYSTWKGAALYLEDIIVTETYRGKGIGKKLHQLMLDEYFSKTKETIWLSTEANSRAETFYKKQGWKNAGFHGNEVKFEMSFEDWRK